MLVSPPKREMEVTSATKLIESQEKTQDLLKDIIQENEGWLSLNVIKSSSLNPKSLHWPQCLFVLGHFHKSGLVELISKGFSAPTQTPVIKNRRRREGLSLKFSNLLYLSFKIPGRSKDFPFEFIHVLRDLVGSIEWDDVGKSPNDETISVEESKW